MFAPVLRCVKNTCQIWNVGLLKGIHESTKKVLHRGLSQLEGGGGEVHTPRPVARSQSFREPVFQPVNITRTSHPSPDPSLTHPFTLWERMAARAVDGIAPPPSSQGSDKMLRHILLSQKSPSQEQNFPRSTQRSGTVENGSFSQHKAWAIILLSLA